MGLVNIEREWDRRIDYQICDKGARVEFEGRIGHTLMHKISMTNLFAWALMQKLTYKGALTRLGIKIKIPR